MDRVHFHTGSEELDQKLDNFPRLDSLFTVITRNHLRRKATESGHPSIEPSHIEVAPYINFDDRPAFAIKAYREFDRGRMVVGDFVVTQLLRGEGTYAAMSLVEDDGTVNVDNLAHYAKNLTLVALLYREANPDTFESQS
jgi:hypothetical protein